MSELEVQHKVATKMVKRHNKELKRQLSKETSKVEALHRKLAAAEKKLADAESAAARAPPSLPTPDRTSRCVCTPGRRCGWEARHLTVRCCCVTTPWWTTAPAPCELPCLAGRLPRAPPVLGVRRVARQAQPRALPTMTG